MDGILVIGSVAVDEVVELDGPLRAGSHNQGRPAGSRIGGGAANTALALARGGVQARVLSAVGADEAGSRLLEALERGGVATELIDRQAPATTRSLVLIDGSGERTLVNLARAAVPLPPNLTRLGARLCYVRSADPALTAPLGEIAQTAILVAHIPPVQDGFRPAQILLGSASDLGAGFLADPYVQGRRIAGERLAWVVITDGPNGAVAWGGGRSIRQPAPPVEVVDSTGAGDVFAAGLLHALAEGLGMDAALPRAVAWGSASVGYPGTQPPADFMGRVAVVHAMLPKPAESDKTPQSHADEEIDR